MLLSAKSQSRVYLDGIVVLNISNETLSSIFYMEQTDLVIKNTFIQNMTIKQTIFDISSMSTVVI